MAMRSFLVNLTLAILAIRGITAFVTTARMTKSTAANNGSRATRPMAATISNSAASSASSTSCDASTTPTTPTPPPPLYLAEGLMAVIKPLTWSSNDVVSYVRGILIRDAKDRGVTDNDDDRNDKNNGNNRKKKWTGRRKNQLMKVGHGGTLDPLASGVLVLGIGKGTTMLQSYLEGDKRYVATVQLGYETDTLDSEGAISKTASWDHVGGDASAIESAVSAKFTGRIKQVPPLYSAIRVGGERLYAIARNNNADPSKTSAADVEIPEREVEVYGLSVGVALGDDVLRSGMVDGPRYREGAKALEDLADAAAAAKAAADAAAVDAIAGDGGDDDDRDDGVEEIGDGGGGGGGGDGGSGKKRKRSGKNTSRNNNNNNSNNNNKKDLFDELTVPRIRPDDGKLEMPQFALSVSCGGGTYIRSLVRDIGYELGTVATMTGLVRTKQGPFELDDALSKEEWTADKIYDAIRRGGGRGRVGGGGDDDDDDVAGSAVLDIRGGGGGEEEAPEEEEEESGSAGDPSPPAPFYPIGTPGKPWTDAERAMWKLGMKIQRSYKEEVLDALDMLDSDVWEVIRYGALSHDPLRYPLFAVRSRNWRDDKPHLLVTGGVHGYETSGVQGAMLFLQSRGGGYAEDVNIVVAPCVSPWAYEHVQRWNADLKDVNRSFKEGSETEESRALMSYLGGLVDVGTSWTCHVDLHETTDTDATRSTPRLG